jgi:hypothetical protein
VSDPFLQDDLRVLTPEAFEFVLGNELKRALRSQTFVTLLLLEPGIPGAQGEADVEHEETVRDVARLVSHEVRETDLLARTGAGQLSLALLDSDLPNATRVIDRLMTRLEHYEFPQPLSFAVGAACCPTHGADTESLRRAASAGPLRQRRQSNAQ